MNAKETSSLNVLLIFFLSYSFYTLQILSQLLFNYYSKYVVSIICFFYILFPLIIYITCKNINKKISRSYKNNSKLISLLTCIYLAITTLISLVYISNIILIYYYQQTSIIILLIFLSLPIIYTLVKGENIFFSLAGILFIIFVLFKYSYLSNFSSHIDLYVFSDIFDIDNNLFLMIFLTLPILLEPVILLNQHKNVSNKINLKFAFIFSMLLSTISILTTLRQTWEFGNLLEIIRFPYLESAKNIMAGKFFENIDYYYLLSLSVSVYIRLGYTAILIKKDWQLNKVSTFIILVILLILTYLLHSNINLGLMANKIVVFSSSLILISILVINYINEIKRRIRDDY